MKKIALIPVTILLTVGCFEASVENQLHIEGATAGSSQTPMSAFCTENPLDPKCNNSNLSTACVGPELEELAFSAEPGPVLDPENPSTVEPVAGCDTPAATCVGQAPPAWQLTDFQPQSCGHTGTYGLEAFQGKVTVFVLLASW